MSTLELRAGGSLRTPMSYEAYVALGETKHHEFYDGLCIAHPPSRRHAVVAARLTRVLQDSRPAGYDVLAEWGWQVESHAVCEPDIMVFRSDAPGEDLLRAAPLLVVEVTSRSTRGEDWGRKREVYAHGGAEWYWIVEPGADTVTVIRNTGGRLNQTKRYGEGTHRLTRPFAVTLDLEALFA